MIRALTVLGIAVLVLSGSAWGQEPAQPAPADQPAAADTKIEVVEVKGTADFRAGADQEWQALKADSPLTPGCEVRTGLRSTVKLKLGANSEVEVKSLTTVAIADLSVNPDDKTIRTRLGKKYGTMKAKVHQVGDLSNDYKISTPSSVLAIRGSGGEHGEYGQTWHVSWEEGQAEHTYHNRTHVLLPSDVINQFNSNPNTPPLNVFVFLGQGGDDLDHEGQDQKEIQKGIDSFNSSIDQAENRDKEIDHGGGDGEGEGNGEGQGEGTGEGVGFEFVGVVG